MAFCEKQCSSTVASDKAYEWTLMLVAGCREDEPRQTRSVYQRVVPSPSKLDKERL